jgi:hypothetical protein
MMKVFKVITGKLENLRNKISDHGLKEAVVSIYAFLTRGIWDEFIDSCLLVAGPPSVFHALYVKIYQPILERRIGSGIKIMEKDWDNLILLDSYRADYFNKYSSLDGELSTVVSKGNWSREFIVKNFRKENYQDTVVISNNPLYLLPSEIEETTFHALIDPTSGKDPDFSSPEIITEAAQNAIDEYPNKRLIIHYMSPHAPHTGAISDRFRKAFENEDFPGMFKLYECDLIRQETLKESYVETIMEIEVEVQKIANNLNGKTVVSSDHGENLGEIQHGMMQLRHGNPTPECRYVPWLEMDYNQRREITEDPPTGSRRTNMDDEEIDRRLSALGYKF